MAVYAAHLTRTLHGAPSVFQVTAQEALGATVKPALRRLVEYVSTVYPKKCGWMVEWYDELYLVFDACLQYHYLKHYAASFSESFYGLLRVPISTSNEFSSGPRLPERLERGSLALLVLLPYLRDKVERVVDKWREDHEDGRLGKSGPDRARRAAIHIYSTLHLVTSLLRLAQLARYTRGAPCHSPELVALGLQLRDKPPEASEQDDYTWRDLLRSVFTGRVGSAVVTFPMVGTLLLRGAEYGAFLVQFLRWWEARGGAGSGASSLTPPPPPERDSGALRWKNKCPICLQTWRIPTVLPVSGYIFCYVCISRHVRARGTCPVSRCPAAESGLVRLYIDE